MKPQNEGLNGARIPPAALASNGTSILSQPGEHPQVIDRPPVDLGGGSSRVVTQSKTVLRRVLATMPAGVRDNAFSAARLLYRCSTRGSTTFLNTQYDLVRYFRYSWALGDPKTPEQLRYFLRMRYHTFEKGLAMPEPRPGFGQGALVALLRALDRYEQMAGYDELVAVVVNVLSRYQEFNATHGLVLTYLDDALKKYIDRYPQIKNVLEGGTVTIRRDEFEAATKIDFDRFVYSRRSIRSYAPEPVGYAVIERAVRIGQKAPSVCNRQAGRVHVFTEKAQVDYVLSFQGGHRGFGHTIPCVMIITVDLQSYYKPGERFQAWIDGGLFAMSLIYGLHAQSLGTCCLNWNVTKTEDAPMRKAIGIPPNEVVITMLAVGYLPETLEAAESPRRPLSEVLFFRDSLAVPNKVAHANGHVDAASGNTRP